MTEQQVMICPRGRRERAARRGRRVRLAASPAYRAPVHAKRRRGGGCVVQNKDEGEEKKSKTFACRQDKHETGPLTATETGGGLHDLTREPHPYCCCCCAFLAR